MNYNHHQMYCSLINLLANVNAPEVLLYDNEPLPEAGPVESEIALRASASVYDVGSS